MKLLEYTSGVFLNEKVDEGTLPGRLWVCLTFFETKNEVKQMRICILLERPKSMTSIKPLGFDTFIGVEEIQSL